MIPNTPLLPQRYKLGVYLFQNSFHFSWSLSTCLFFTFVFEPALTSYQRISDLNSKILCLCAFHTLKVMILSFESYIFTWPIQKERKETKALLHGHMPGEGLEMTGPRVGVLDDWACEAARAGKKRWDLEIVQQPVGHGVAGDHSRCGRMGWGRGWKRMEKELGTRENLIIRCANRLQACFRN